MNPANRNNAQGQPAQPGQQQQQPQRPNIINMVLMYMAISYVMNNFFKSGNNAPVPNSAYVNVFRDNEPIEFKMFISDSPNPNDDKTLFWEETGLEYNYKKENAREKNIVFNIDDLLKNGSEPELYAHVFLQSVRSVDSDNYSDYSQFLYRESTINLVDWRKKNDRKEESLLFNDDNDKKEKEEELASKLNLTADNTTYPHLKAKIWLQLVHDTNAYQPGQLPPQLSPQFYETELGNKIYTPILDTSQFWLRKKDYVPIEYSEDNNRTVNTTFYFNTYWIYKYMMENQFKQTNQLYEQFGISKPDENMDEIKEMVLDTNPILFTVTFVVSLLHSVFEFLALKNDIAFWKNVESHKGLSLRTLWVSLVTEIIILLYLFDNETSYLILLSSVAELAVTVWKIFKTTKFRKRADGKFPFVEIDYQDAYKSTTMEYDQIANKYLMWAFIPLLFGYAIYSLIYEKHKGWYSFVVQTLVGFIYVFGFIQMTPQLYINYKLKSVEHLPWRVMIYKFLNTIVDDLFAFVITMPWLKRLSCFRDDIIFIIYLYQRWHYRVDKNRDPYGNLIKKETAPTPGQVEAATQPIEAAAQQDVPSSQTEKKATREVNLEEDTVTHRNVQEQPKEAEPSAQEEATEPNAAASENKGPKMKKKKTQ